MAGNVFEQPGALFDDSLFEGGSTPSYTAGPPGFGLRVDILTPAGVKVGQGPILTATSWKSMARLDRAGQFSFQMPASDSRAAYLAYHNIAVGMQIVNGVWTEIGRGIIDDITVSGSAASTMLTVAGPDMLGQLAWRTVGNLTLATATTPTVVNPGITSLTPTDIHKLHIDVAGGGNSSIGNSIAGGVYNPFPYGYEQHGAWFDGNTGTHQSNSIGSWHFMYICYDDPYTSVNFFLWTPQTDVCSWRVQYYNGTTWIDLSGIVDQTTVGGKTLSQNGSIGWTFPVDWQPIEQSICPIGDFTQLANYTNLTGYWTRWIPVGPPADGDAGSVVDIREITINGVVPTNQAVAQILGIADGLDNAVADVNGNLTGSLRYGGTNLGWSLDTTAGLSTSLRTDIFGTIQDDTVLAGLIKLSELSNEHFRVGVGNKLVWLGKNTPSSGIRAVRPVDGNASAGNAQICPIVSMTRQTSTAQLCTRVFPYGAGTGTGRITLKDSNRPTSGSFLDPNNVVHTFFADLAHNTIADVTAFGQYNYLDSVQVFNYIAPAIGLTPPSRTLAANALYDAALVYLIHHSQPIVTFNVVVTGLKTVLYPGQTVRVIWKELTDVATVLDLDQTLIILETTNDVTPQGYVTTGMVLSQYPRWPLSDVEILAQLQQTLRHVGQYPQALDISAVAIPAAHGVTSGQAIFATGRGGIASRSTRSG